MDGGLNVELKWSESFLSSVSVDLKERGQVSQVSKRVAEKCKCDVGGNMSERGGWMVRTRRGSGRSGRGRQGDKTDVRPQGACTFSRHKERHETHAIKPYVSSGFYTPAQPLYVLPQTSVGRL